MKKPPLVDNDDWDGSEEDNEGTLRDWYRIFAGVRIDIRGSPPPLCQSLYIICASLSVGTTVHIRTLAKGCMKL
jgi:hypothetical protein